MCEQVNTSRLGYDVFNTSETSSNPIISFFKNITNEIESAIEDGFSSIAKDLGVHDFYTASLMNYCEGFYEPGPVPNTTVSRSDISMNVTYCSNRTSSFNFDLKTILQRELNNSGHSNINITELKWPEEIDEGLDDIKSLIKATFVIYCIAIGLLGLSTLLAYVSVFFEGRISAFINVSLELLTFIVIGVASAIGTAFAVKATDIINRYGRRVGIAAYRGNKFLALTWAATGLVLVASVIWCFACLLGRSRRNGPRTGPKKH